MGQKNSPKLAEGVSGGNFKGRLLKKIWDRSHHLSEGQKKKPGDWEVRTEDRQILLKKEVEQQPKRSLIGTRSQGGIPKQNASRLGVDSLQGRGEVY